MVAHSIAIGQISRCGTVEILKTVFSITDLLAIWLANGCIVLVRRHGSSIEEQDGCHDCCGKLHFVSEIAA